MAQKIKWKNWLEWALALTFCVGPYAIGIGFGVWTNDFEVGALAFATAFFSITLIGLSIGVALAL